MRFLLIFVVCFSFVSCDKEEKCNYLTYDYKFDDSSKVDTISTPVSTDISIFTAKLATGNKLVFSYQISHVDCPGIVDGGGGSLLLFEIDPSLNSFNYNSDSLAAINCYYRTFGMVITNSYIPQGGTIKGTKINDNNWKVEGDLILNNGDHLQFSHVFTK